MYNWDQIKNKLNLLLVQKRNTNYNLFGKIHIWEPQTIYTLCGIYIYNNFTFKNVLPYVTWNIVDYSIHDLDFKQLDELNICDICLQRYNNILNISEFENDVYTKEEE